MSAGLFVATLLLFLAADSALALKPHQRSRWMTGIQLGVGQAKLTVNDPNNPGASLDRSWEQGMMPGLRFGWVFIPNKLMVSFENKQWIDEQPAPDELVEAIAPDEPFLKLRANVQHFTLALTWFPGKPENPWGGLWLKAGGGFANARFTVLRLTTEDEQMYGDKFHKLIKNDDAGVAAFAELGYELRIIKPMAAGLCLQCQLVRLRRGRVLQGRGFCRNHPQRDLVLVGFTAPPSPSYPPTSPNRRDAPKVSASRSF